MLNSKNFSMRLTGEDQQMLFEMARHFERTKGDVLRLLIRNAHKNFGPGVVHGGGNPNWPGDMLPGQVAVEHSPDEVSAMEAVPT